MAGVQIILIAILGVFCGILGAMVASKRNLAQPIESDIKSENLVLEYLEKDPAQWVRAMTEMRVLDYSNKARRERYEKIENSARLHLREETVEQIKTASREGDEKLLQEIVDTLRKELGGVALSVEEVKNYLDAGSSVVSNAAGREQNTERSKIVETGDDERPYKRESSEPSVQRLSFAGVCGGIGGVIAYLVPSARWDGPAVWYGVLTMLLVLIGGVIVSYVDVDTYYLDTQTFWVWALASWLAVLASVWVAGESKTALTGGIAAAAVALGFEVVAFVWGKLRGLTQGAGDTWIAICTCGVPSALCGDWRVAVWSVLYAAILAAGHWSYLAAFKGASRETPVPFGPWLVAGGFVASLTWVVLQ
jgi:prepilin signal peptidase PulO-like enzyme (type II secretory pathway)